MATRAKEKDGKNRQTQYDRQGYDDATRWPERALGRNGGNGALERRRGSCHRWNGQPVALELMPKLCLRRDGQPVALELVPRLGPIRVCVRKFWSSYAAVLVDKRHVRDETIATFWKSLDISGILRRVS
jgi:hypothetical protein